MMQFLIETSMFSNLRRYELGKMLLNLVPVLVGAGIASKLFTGLPAHVILLIYCSLVVVSFVAVLILPKSVEINSGKRK